VVDEHLDVIQPIRDNEDGKCWVDRFGDFFEEELLYVVNGQLNPTFRLNPGEVQRWRFLKAGMSEHLPSQRVDKNRRTSTPLPMSFCVASVFPLCQDSRRLKLTSTTIRTGQTKRHE
jgi:hypothetical protein